MTNFVVVIVSISLIVNGLWWATPASSVEDPSHSHDQIQSDLGRMVSRFRNLSSSLEKSHMNIENLLDKTAFDSSEIIDYVKHNIRFQAYRGILRGVRGTLISQSGNAVDQSMLLGALLRDAGYEARIARGRLSRDMARLMISSMKEPGNWPAAFHEKADLGELLAGISKRNFENPDELSRGLADFSAALEVRSEEIGLSIDRINEATTRSLGSHLVDIGKGFADQLVSEQVDYYWVQYREAAETPDRIVTG